MDGFLQPELGGRREEAGFLLMVYSLRTHLHCLWEYSGNLVLVMEMTRKESEQTLDWWGELLEGGR